ncbi:ABC transporter permease subunit [Thalassotalea sp. HSM 43]|uniref:ABC transporter permease subunit n=1 Tax=Thalassotalea sp. HSM 43 TaxID=2552945 RepID=UPI00107FE14C|nr:ABC transporter permease subunit [Thalassotalea sp. HSM 43]QBY05303.1 ABC transporter permease subunit [Thalassotalea sp. HSM 43]
MARNHIYLEEEFPSPIKQLWLTFKSTPVAIIGFGVYAFLAALALVGNFIAPHDALENNLDKLLLPPAWSENGDLAHLLGTDDLGRDMLSRLINGASLTFGLSFLVVLFAMSVGVIIGSFSAITRGVKSSFLTHFLDVILSIPSLLLAIIIVAILGPGLENVLWAIALVSIPQFVHVTRNAIKEEQTKDYVLIPILDGASEIRVLITSIYPNIIDKIIIQATLAQSAAILEIAALGFLGLGAPIPMPEWGSMLANSLDLFYIAPWTTYLPGLAILTTVMATNLVGEGLRHSLKIQKES